MKKFVDYSLGHVGDTTTLPFRKQAVEPRVVLEKEEQFLYDTQSHSLQWWLHVPLLRAQLQESRSCPVYPHCTSALNLQAAAMKE